MIYQCRKNFYLDNSDVTPDDSLLFITSNRYCNRQFIQLAYQLIEFEGSFYFINDGDKIVRSKKLYLSDKFVEGKTFADGTAITAGYYYFDADGKMVIE